MTTNNSVETFTVRRTCNVASALLKLITRRRLGPIWRQRGQLILSHRRARGVLFTPSLQDIAVPNAVMDVIV